MISVGESPMTAKIVTPSRSTDRTNTKRLGGKNRNISRHPKVPRNPATSGLAWLLVELKSVGSTNWQYKRANFLPRAASCAATY